MNGAKPQLPLYDSCVYGNNFIFYGFLFHGPCGDYSRCATAFCTDARLENGGKYCSSLCTSCIVIEFFKIAICVLFLFLMKNNVRPNKCEVKVKVNFTLEEVTKVQRGIES